jgi:hypothetical protein
MHSANKTMDEDTLNDVPELPSCTSLALLTGIASQGPTRMAKSLSRPHRIFVGGLKECHYTFPKTLEQLCQRLSGSQATFYPQYRRNGQPAGEESFDLRCRLL